MLSHIPTPLPITSSRDASNPLCFLSIVHPDHFQPQNTGAITELSREWGQLEDSSRASWELAFHSRINTRHQLWIHLPIQSPQAWASIWCCCSGPETMSIILSWGDDSVGKAFAMPSEGLRLNSQNICKARCNNLHLESQWRGGRSSPRSLLTSSFCAQISEQQGAPLYHKLENEDCYPWLSLDLINAYCMDTSILSQLSVFMCTHAPIPPPTHRGGVRKTLLQFLSILGRTSLWYHTKNWEEHCSQQSSYQALHSLLSGRAQPIWGFPSFSPVKCDDDIKYNLTLKTKQQNKQKSQNKCSDLITSNST